MDVARRAFRSISPVFTRSFVTACAAAAIAALSAACSSTDAVETGDIRRAGAGSRAPSVNEAQLTVIAAYRSVCLGTSFDQGGAERALFELGYKPARSDGGDGERRFAKGGARVVLSGGPQPGGGLPGAAGAAPGSSYCAVSYDGLGQREAAAVLEEAIRGSGLPYGPQGAAASGDEARATVEGSDFYGVASVVRNLGDSGLELTKSAKASR